MTDAATSEMTVTLPHSQQTYDSSTQINYSTNQIALSSLLPIKSIAVCRVEYYATLYIYIYYN